MQNRLTEGEMTSVKLCCYKVIKMEKVGLVIALMLPSLSDIIKCIFLRSSEM